MVKVNWGKQGIKRIDGIVFQANQKEGEGHPLILKRVQVCNLNAHLEKPEDLRLDIISSNPK